MASKRWRRWIGALCVALLAFVLIEQASPEHAIADAAHGGVAAIGGDSHGASASLQGEAGKPLTPDAPAHHCCVAHTGSPAPAAQGAVIVAGSADVPVMRDAEHAPQSAPSGLDRPPKISATG
ncbi:MAG: hypothetical protein NVV62_08190 [Terricaulis sp.]|nr:hypothetical protein [Terricaulis sp.]